MQSEVVMPIKCEEKEGHVWLLNMQTDKKT